MSCCGSKKDVDRNHKQVRATKILGSNDQPVLVADSKNFTPIR